MWPNPQFPADLVTFTEEIINGKLHFLCSVTSILWYDLFKKITVALLEHIHQRHCYFEKAQKKKTKKKLFPE